MEKRLNILEKERSSWKRTEEVLKQTQKDLEIKIKERGIELEQAKAELKEEIEKRKKTEDNLKHIYNDLKFLYRTATEFLEISSDNNIYELIGERLTQIVGRSFVVINAYDKHTNLFHTKSINGLGKHTDRILALLNKNPVGMIYELNDDNARQLLKSGKLVPGPVGLHELSFGAVPASICSVIEKLLGVGDIYVVGFSRRGEIYGSGIIITRHVKETPDILENREVIETFFNQAAVAIQRKQFEDALKDSETKFRALIETTSDWIWETDQNSVYVYCSPKVTDILGYEPQEVVGKTPFDFMPKNEAAKIAGIFGDLLESCESFNNLENICIHKDGRELLLETSGVPIIDERRKLIGYRGIDRDITDRKILETRILDSQKMQGIATLAGGIAHQFNNALSPITVNLDILDMDIGGDENIANCIKQMRNSAQQMSQLTSQLLAYARGGKYQAKTISLGEFVRDTLPLVRHTIHDAVDVDTDLLNNLLYVKADLTQLQMVLATVMQNASEAIKGEGRIKISTENQYIDDSFANRYPDIKSGSYVRLTIEDNGKGMDNETMRRIFEPFFTTKFQGRGLGMAAVHGIIKNHDGLVTVDSELDKGTTVHIFLPAIEERVVKTEQPGLRPTKGKDTILVIEDEEMVMDINRAVMKRLGYRILEAKSGSEAINIANTFDGEIDVALLDIALPDMKGDAIYPFLIEARPNIKVIVCSGYALDGPVQEILNAGAHGFVQKPFTIATLSEQITKVLKI